MKRTQRLRILAFFFVVAWVGAVIPVVLAQAAQDAVFRESIEQLRVAAQAIAQGRLADAKSTYSALLQRHEIPAHHGWEAKERLQEIERMGKGLPARDPATTRVALPARPKPAATFAVAPDGNDANPGTKEKPFHSLERARDAIRSLSQAGVLPAGGVEVCLRGGEYPVLKSFELTSQDSGTEASPIIYRAMKGETPIFRGGIRLTGFQPASDADVLARLPEESHSKVLYVDLKSLGITNLKPLELGGFCSGRGFTTHPTQELFFNGQAMTLARWPNQEYVTLHDIVVHDGKPSHGLVGSKTGLLQYDGNRPERWLKESDAWLYGYWFWGWADSYERIASIDPTKHEIALATPYSTYGYRKGQPFYAVNVLAEIDMPGEWYLDRTNSVLYFWPPSDPNQAIVELSVNDFPFLKMQHVSHITLEGITWELGGGDAVLIRDGDHCLIAGCTVRRCSGNGIEIDGGTDHGILSCDVSSLGRGGVVISGGNRKTLSPGRHFVENCNIHDLSRIDRTYTSAIVMSGVGNRIAHNSLHDIPSSAMRVGGNDHLVEYNDVYRVVLESDDQGGADMFGDPTIRGIVYRFNYWHHIGNWRHSNEGPDCGRAGIRLDDAISGVLIYGNIFYRAASGKLGFGGVQIHGGKDNILDNNLFVDCESAVSFSPWGAERWKTFTSEFLTLPEVDWDLYVAKYPKLAALSEDADRNTIARSLVVQCREFLRRDSHRNQLLDNLETAEDPGFRNRAQGDLEVKDSAPLPAGIGWRPIPFSEIGLYTDEWRNDLPPRVHEGE
jgi:hypothetical protein